MSARHQPVSQAGRASYLAQRAYSQDSGKDVKVRSRDTWQAIPDNRAFFKEPPVVAPAPGPYTAVPQNRRPRHAYVPPQARAPVSLKKHATYNRFECNEDPEKLDRVYANMLGPGGEQLLTDEVKWLAITHKSFDQGRRGFNDRMAFMGKRVVDLQTSLAILAQPSGSHYQPKADPYGRTPFAHPAMDILHKLNQTSRSKHVDRNRMAALAGSFGLEDVVRWKPKDARDLEWSGLHGVTTGAMYAIVGALMLQRGGEQAIQVVREALLPKLGLVVE